MRTISTGTGPIIRGIAKMLESRYPFVKLKITPLTVNLYRLSSKNVQERGQSIWVMKRFAEVFVEGWNAREKETNKQVEKFLSKPSR